MPVIPRWEDDENPIVMPIVAHFNSGQEAAAELWRSLESITAMHGGSPEIIKPVGMEGDWGVRWTVGPENWAETYCKDPYTSTDSFKGVATAEDTVMFVETD